MLIVRVGRMGGRIVSECGRGVGDEDFGKMGIISDDLEASDVHGANLKSLPHGRTFLGFTSYLRVLIGIERH